MKFKQSLNGQQKTYKRAPENAVECLDEAAGHAMARVLKIAFAVEYEKLGRLHEMGEMLQVEPAAFDCTGSANIDLI